MVLVQSPDGIYLLMPGLLAHSNAPSPMMGPLTVNVHQFLLQWPLSSFILNHSFLPGSKSVMRRFRVSKPGSPCMKNSPPSQLCRPLWVPFSLWKPELQSAEAGDTCLSLKPKVKSSFPRMLRKGGLDDGSASHLPVCCRVSVLHHLDVSTFWVPVRLHQSEVPMEDWRIGPEKPV